MSPVLGPGRPRLLGMAVLVVTFLAGAMAGAAIARVTAGPAPAREAASDERRDGDRRSYVIDRVDMTDAQRERIEAILKGRAQRMREVWRQASPTLEAITDSTRAEIMDVLTPEQQAEYERLLEERHRAHRARRGPHEDTAAGSRGADAPGADTSRADAAGDTPRDPSAP